jgi:hypothetical protein
VEAPFVITFKEPVDVKAGDSLELTYEVTYEGCSLYPTYKNIKAVIRKQLEVVVK